MIDTQHIDHHIQRHIIDVLMHAESARFKDMRPNGVDSNLYSYHLGSLLKNGMVEKADTGYRLARNGVVYVDRVSTSTLNPRLQPKIITMFVIQNDEGELLVSKRRRQPFIGKWTLPNGKIHIDDRSLDMAAAREAAEKLGYSATQPVRAGECYVRTVHDDTVVMGTLAHIYKFNANDIATDEFLRWVKPHRLGELELAPAIEQIVARTFFNDSYFFEEYEETW